MLAGVDLARDWEAFSELGAFPLTALPTFIHEGVHHWCFHSVVGAALAVLRHRARSNVMAWLRRDDHDAGQSAIEDLMRFETASNLLRPLSEGLAVFAEHDVTPNFDTPTVTQPMRWTYFSFTRPSDEELETHWGASLIHLLYRLRLERSNVTRKANLLVGPLACDEGGYLAGYLTVKTLWIISTDKDERFWDTDLFFGFLRRYVYNDYGFVDVLLSKESIGRHASETIAEYFQLRLASFRALDLSDDLDEYMRSSLAPPKLLPGKLRTSVEFAEQGYAPIAVNPKRHASGKRVLAEAITALGATELGSVAELGLAQRHLMRLGSAVVQVGACQGGKVRALVGDKTLFESPALAPFHDGAIGSLDLYLSMADIFEAVALSIDEKLIALDFRGDPPPIMREQLEMYVMNRGRADMIDGAFDAGLKAFISATGFGAEYADIRAHLIESVGTVYVQHTVNAWVRPDLRIATTTAMRRNGFFDVVGRDLELVEMLAALTLASSMRLTAGEVDAAIPELPMRAESALQQLLRCEKTYGYPLVVDREVMLASYV